MITKLEFLFREACVFDPAWSDDQDAPGGHDGCDTRNNVLAQDLSDVVFKPGTRDCVVLSGAMTDPYSGDRIEFERSQAKSVQIDHVFPLAAAWDFGANSWTPALRMRFANDMSLNLLAVNGPDNQAKGDSTPSDWLPPNPSAFDISRHRSGMDFEEFRLAASTADLADEPAARDHADVVEFRMDLATNPLDALRNYDGGLPLLVTNRVEWEGGEAPDGDERFDALETAVEHPHVEAVDLELAALESGDAERVREHARGQDVQVVVSTHNFERTPDSERLHELLHSACEYGDVGKLAVTADSPGDVLDVLDATWELTSAGETVATMAMGEAGRHSRAVAPLYGSRIGYAPVDPADATAPGQYDLATLRHLVGQLAGNSASAEV